MVTLLDGGFKFTAILLHASIVLWYYSANAQRSDCHPVKVDLVIIVDSSGSVQDVFDKYVSAAEDFTQALTFGPDGAQAAIIQYSKSPPLLKHTFGSAQNGQAIHDAIAGLLFLGDMTNTADAVNLGLQQYGNGRQDAQKVFVLMTDGNSFDPWQTVLDTTARLHATRATVYIIALGDNLYYPELKLYAGNGSLITRNDLSRFKADINDLAGGCPQAPLTPRLTSYVTPPLVETTTTTVRPAYSPVATEAPAPAPSSTTTTAAAPYTQCPIPEGYCPCTTAGQPSVAPTTFRPILPPSAPCAVDILFVLDSSGEDRTNFDKQIRFVLDLLDILTINPKAHLVSAMVYDGHMRQRIQFSFTAYTNIQALSTAVTDLPFFGGVAAAGEGLTLAKQALQDRRPNVPAVIFVITNGSSTDDVKGPASALRHEPNVEVYAISVAENVDKQRLIDIAGDADHVFTGIDAERVKKVALGKYLNCPNLKASKFKMLRK